MREAVRSIITISDFEMFTAPLLGLPVSHIWRGHGSALFLEFGQLEPRWKSDGTVSNPEGEWTVMVEWDWRIEGKRYVWCGSSSDEERWQRIFRRIEGAKVVSIVVSGRLLEMDLTFSNGLHLVSFITTEGNPKWGLIHHKSAAEVGAEAGRLVLSAPSL